MHSDFLKTYTRENLKSIIRNRANEQKAGDAICCVSNNGYWHDDVYNSDCKFVLIGLPEDIGVRANFGRGGAHTAWQPALANILNIQSNRYFSGEELFVLGHIEFYDLMHKSTTVNPKEPGYIQKLRELVTEVDKRVSNVIQQITALKKIPVIIGGGHNNAYPNIEGTAKGLTKENGINCINLDAHSDFRALEGRHSGNGFSYAFENNLLNKYAIVSLQENYNPDAVLKQLDKYPDRILYHTFEDIILHEKFNFKDAVQSALNFVNKEKFGVELDLDVIQNIPSSAKTSSGLSANQARQYVTWCGQQSNVSYLHIAEAAPVLSHIKTDNKTGKLIAYLVSDFIKANGVDKN